MNSDMAKAILAKVQEKKASGRERWDYVPNTSPASLNVFKDLIVPAYQQVSQVPSSVAQNSADAFKHVTKSIGNYFTRNPVEKQIADLRDARIASKGTVEQNDLARRVILGSLGMGLGAGGLYALYKAFNRPKTPKREDEEMALQYPVERTKAAESNILESLLGKQQNPSIWDNPLFVPGLALGGLSAVYGGLKGSTYLANKIEEKARKDELAKAKREFHDALISSYDEPLSHDPLHTPTKNASDNTMLKLSETLDKLYDACFEKKALDWTAGGAIPTAIAAALPTYLTLGSLGALGAGSMAYDATKKHSKAEALKKALRERARLKYEQSPPELYISPEAIDVSELKKQRSSVV